jgi:YVTN family beta-propeller protein
MERYHPFRRYNPQAMKPKRVVILTLLLVLGDAAGRVSTPAFAAGRVSTPALAAEMPSPALIVLVKGANELAIVDPTTLKIVARVPTGEAPHEVTLSADGRTAYVGNYGSRTPGQTISIIDLAAQKEVKRVDLGALRRPHGMVQSGGKVYFTAEINKAIGRYDPQSGAIDWLMGTGQNSTHMLVLTRDESKIFTANIASDSVSLLERGANGAWNATVIPVGKGPEGIAMTPDEREVWAAHSRDGGISIIDVAGKKVVQTLAGLTRRSNRIQFTPDGKRALVTDLEGGEVVVLDTASRKEIRRIKTGGQPEGLLITPDGARAFVGLGSAGAVAVIDLGSLEVRGQIPTGPESDGLAWAK